MYQPFPSVLFAMACRTGVCEELKLNEIVELLSTEDNVISNKITKPRAGDIYVCKDDENGEKLHIFRARARASVVCTIHK